MTILEYGTRILAGLVLAIVSTAALVLALAGMVSSPVEQGMAIAAGVALQICLYLFARNKKDQWLSWVLLVVSVLATAAFMEYAWQQQRAGTVQQQQSATADNYVAQQLKQQIDDINRQMAIRLNVSERDTSGNFRTRGINQLDDEVSDLTEERNQLLSQLQEIETASATAPAGSMDAVVGNAPWLIRLVVFLALSLLLDYCTIRCLSTPMPERAKKKKLEDTEEKKSASTEAAKPETVLAEADSENADHPVEDKPEPTEETISETTIQPQALQIDETVQRIAQRVRNGEYGTQPVVRKIIDAEGVRHPVVKQAFDLLQTEGVLVKNGQRFELMKAA
ncbi:hypothetical protein GZ77_07295 [Endozoicomonas montiporae]|uniref:Uncharacterized protein n=2 Tax=Endozoicomonas montiporae TaxID=1027273 RepID=A0A081N6Z8_9GAMM|nr:hypothetical protein [Endozoicomonas montiporae]AMO55971.1 hypothetical protein EZMO1_1828 [Endozoicomonas montiporae CL-33]KEQ14221.1 hypothetical protein GZ77_07295 [Endozoicomonas montiporae]